MCDCKKRNYQYQVAWRKRHRDKYNAYRREYYRRKKSKLRPIDRQMLDRLILDKFNEIVKSDHLPSKKKATALLDALTSKPTDHQALVFLNKLELLLSTTASPDPATPRLTLADFKICS